MTQARESVRDDTTFVSCRGICAKRVMRYDLRSVWTGVVQSEQTKAAVGTWNRCLLLHRLTAGLRTGSDSSCALLRLCLNHVSWF